MAKKTSKNPVGRRGFLKGAAAGAAALVAGPVGLKAQEAQAQNKGAATTLPGARLAAAESSPPPARVDVYTTDRPGSDFMVDVIKSLGFEYVLANPGSSFRGLHESLLQVTGGYPILADIHYHRICGHLCTSIAYVGSGGSKSTWRGVFR